MVHLFFWFQSHTVPVPASVHYRRNRRIKLFRVIRMSRSSRTSRDPNVSLCGMRFHFIPALRHTFHVVLRDHFMILMMIVYVVPSGFIQNDPASADSYMIVIALSPCLPTGHVPPLGWAHACHSFVLQQRLTVTVLFPRCILWTIHSRVQTKMRLDDHISFDKIAIFTIATIVK